MHDYLFDTELVRLALVLSVVIGLGVYERLGVTTGGTIVPGYMALFLLRPTHIAATVGVALLTYLIVYHFLRPRYMLWGQRLFETELLVALVLQVSWMAVVHVISALSPELIMLYGVGFLLPGLMAHDMGRQGVRTTLVAGTLVTLLIYGLLVLVSGVRGLLGLPAGAVATVQHSQAQAYAYPIAWLPAGVVVSVMVSYLLHRGREASHIPLAQPLRAGGFVTAGYLALFVLRPADLAFVIVCSAITYVLVAGILARRTLLFGRVAMAVMFVTGIAVTWLAETVLASSGLGFVPWPGFKAITPVVVALMANDALRQGPLRTGIGAGLATATVWVTMSVVGLAFSAVGLGLVG
jgi:poly-gamma-glutamate biosynthesis protein PgsC/CapC